MAPRRAPTGPGSARRHRRVIAWPLALGLVVAACGRGGSDGSGKPEGGSSDGVVQQPDLVGPEPDGVAAPAKRTTEPPASDLGGAFAVVEERVLEAAEIIDALLQHPGVVDDPADPEVLRLRRLYSDDSLVPDQVVALLRSLTDEGRRMRAAPTGFFRELGVYDMTVIDDRAIGFYACYVEDVQVVDTAGTVVDEYARVVQGNGAAKRVDGIWRLVAMVPIEGFSRPLLPGVANPDICDDVATAAAQGPTG